MRYRPQDIWSAAFYNDIQRLRLLATQDVPGGVVDNEEEALEDTEEEAIDSHPEMVNVLAQYELGPTSDDDDGGTENAIVQMNDDRTDVELQEEDFALFRRIIRRQVREAALSRNINTLGLLRVRNSPVDFTPYGIFFSIRELCHAASPLKGDYFIPSYGNASKAEVQLNPKEMISLKVNWKPSKRSLFKASPLHWAILGRSYESIQLLIELGADSDLEICQTVPSQNGSSSNSLCNITKKTCKGGCVAKGLTPSVLASLNDSHLTLKILQEAVAARQKLLEIRNEEKKTIESRLEQRKARREKEQLSREQRRMQQEESEQSNYSSFAELDRREEG